MKKDELAAASAFPRPLVLSLALAFPLWPCVASAAATVSASGSFNDGVKSFFADTPKSGSFDQPATSVPFSVGVSGERASYWDSATYLYAKTLADGQFGFASSNDKAYGSDAPMTSDVQLVYADSIVNTSGVAQNVNFGLAISQLAIKFEGGTQFSSSNNIASFSAAVYVGASTTAAWSSGFVFNSTSTATSGTDLGLGAAYSSLCAGPNSYMCNPFSSGAFGISGYSTSVDLGSLAANDSLAVRYVIDLHTETDMYGGVASISFNDPSGLSIGSGQPASASLSLAAVSSVPEPESYLAMAVGLGVLGASRHRRRRIVG